ncbi:MULTISPECIES: YkgJ family cysteine cluster protein [Methylococcus]|uniref:YkgJ family cysteine cluster protein n=1 Tax=Methylococcus capsulatus TaxID=414 RepID=A0ABZ2F454_METCP|nr:MULTISPECIES: YkgJ family cysteine cluster protein [Methylococcus]MDF9391765.1 YkgJ family cysteine cluster protein [Methylococcus capsulatus]
MTAFLRRPHHSYQDPLARIWIACAENIGFRVARSPEVYASTDGRGTILIGTDDLLDPDDSLAQMIFHELCHALVEGEAGEAQVDWGLDNTSNRHLWREQACLRLQAYLADGVGLGDFFAPTTDFRVKFWPNLGDDPMTAPPDQGGRREPSCVAARLAVWRASQPRWAPHLQAALAATAAIARVVPRHITSDDGQLPSLWATVTPPPPMHPAGHAAVARYRVEAGCTGCAWSYAGRRGMSCRHAQKARIPPDAPACMRWEPAEDLDCLSCGACCREAYQAVEISAREPLVRLHPELVVSTDGRRKLRRDGGRCAALTGGNAPAESYACGIYPDRPRTCRDFTRGSANCLDARRRVGLSL